MNLCQNLRGKIHFSDERVSPAESTRVDSVEKS